MNKAALFAIQPKFCDAIIDGRKTIEVRKTVPKLETPFTGYIYCTKSRHLQYWGGPRYGYADDHSHNAFDLLGSGKVIGEFRCGDVHTLFEGSDLRWWRGIELGDYGKKILRETCLTLDELLAYSAGKDLQLIYLSDVKRYDKPKELSEFYLPGTLSNEDFLSKLYDGSGDPARRDYASYLFTRKLRRPPQSWCYVEEFQ